MRYVIVLLTLFITYSSFSQLKIDEKEAVQIAINYGIAEPLDSFEVTLNHDTIWEVKSLFCEDYYHSQSEIYRIHAITGEKYEENLGILVMADFTNTGPTTDLNYNSYVDSLLPINKHEPRLIVPDEFSRIYDLSISPDNRWIAISYQGSSIAVASLDGKQYKKICDDCLSLRWTDRENILAYIKDHKRICEYNVITNEYSQIKYMDNRYRGYSYSPTGNWLAFVKSVQRKAEDPNVILVFFENEEHDLFIQSLHTGRERRITTEGSVSGPWWKSTGDTIFFYMNDVAHYVTRLDEASPEYRVAEHLEKITIRDYTNCVNGRFPYINHCQLILVDLVTLKPVKFILKKRGRYNNIRMSNDGKFIVYTLKKQHKTKVYLIENEN